MSLFFDRAVNTSDGSINVNIAWHDRFPLLAIGSYSEDKGGYVCIYDDEGEVKDEKSIPAHATAQVTALAWHPEKKILIVGWENGEIYLYIDSKSQCLKVDTLHQSAVTLLQWSTRGSRLISTDKNGSVIGWRIESDTQLHVVFHHELKDPIVGLVYCSASTQNEQIDITGLARAAVNGDEQALDMFSSWRPKTGANRNLGTVRNPAKENLNSYAGAASGIIYFLNENGSCMEVLQAEGAIKTLLHHVSSDVLIVVTENMVIGQFQIDNDGTLSEISKVKMSTRSKENHITWAGVAMLAITSGEMSIRIWNLKNDDNYVLQLPSTQTSNTAEFITCLAFCEEMCMLAAGTNAGSILIWCYPPQVMIQSETDWTCLPRITIGNTIKEISWGSVQHLLGVNTVRQVFILKEQKLSVAYKNGVSALQSTPSNLSIDFYGAKKSTKSTIATDVQIQGVFMSDNNLVLWGGKKVITYDVQREIGHLMHSGEFMHDCEALVCHEKSIFTLENDRINVRSFQGTIKQTLNLSDSEGQGITISVNGNFLVVGTVQGFVKVWDLSKREARPHAHPLNLNENIQDFGEIIAAKSNFSGTYISICVANSNMNTDPKLYVMDLENDTLRYFNFASGRNDQEDHTVPPNSANSKSGSPTSLSDHASGREVSNRYVVEHDWDANEPHLLVCQTRSLMTEQPPARQEQEHFEGEVMVSLFIHDDLGIVVHDIHPFPDHSTKLVSVDIPFLVVLRESKVKEQTDHVIERSVMKDFQGLEASDKATRDAVVKFSFYMSIGNMDEAFKSIKTVKNQKVWGNMARMCVKTQRLDVAAICLGNMQHAHGARAIRQIQAAKVDKDVKTAVLAIYLDMPEEAERMLVRCGRYDMLNKFYQDSGQWQKALQVAEDYDRMHLRSTHYNFAKHLEHKGDIAGAIHNFERSGTHRFEVPRLLFEDWSVLEAYIMKSNDKSLKRWWAQYMESTGEMDVALQYYELAEDYLSLVRVYCYCDNLDKAADIANASGDKAACYHLARQYENIDNIQEAIHFFSKAHAYSNAIRICREQGFDEQLWNLALLAGSQEKLEAAKYFENADKPKFDKAVVLYEKAGYLGKALDLAFQTNQHSVLQFISTNLSEDTDPALLEKTAKFFLENQQYEKAVDLFAASRNPKAALSLCQQYNIRITEELAEKMSAGKDMTEAEKLETLNMIAEVCFQQGNYHLATKKWTQAGNRLQAMKALLKSGDTEKIIFFANVSREREIYILAGNYLQTLDWRNNPDIMRHIINFYNKSRAYDNLAMFYYACSEVEIDEYQNYEKALGALSECLKCLNRSEDPNPQRIEQVTRNVDFITRFVEAQQIYSMDPQRSISMCNDLLKEPDINAAVRKGDIYGFMIDNFVRQQNYKVAHQMIEELRHSIPNVNLAYYVNTDTLTTIENALGITLVNRSGGGIVQEPESDEEVVN